jgi:phenylalanyl-tRNA synthetase alpha chain
MDKTSFKNLEAEAEKELKEAESLADLEVVYKKYLGKQGKITVLLRSLKNLPEKERKEYGKLANKVKQLFEKEITERRKALKGQKDSARKEWFDITRPGKKIKMGHLHPLTQVKKMAEEIFESMGFEITEGPEVETEWYNFDALNIPAEHPARDMWDTFWLRQNEIKNQKAKIKNERLLLRTHTSPVQIRYMEKHNPPLRIIAPGKIFRHEATDASHEFQFYQLEGLMVGNNISAANFKAVLEEFFSRFFRKQVKIRLRPSYFPFTEPSFEVDVSCVVCNGNGCSVCKKSGWLEIMGAGMVHPAVYKNSGLNPKGLTGFAFGMGLDRLAMLKYKINEIRWFHSGDLRFLEQF